MERVPGKGPGAALCDKRRMCHDIGREDCPLSQTAGAVPGAAVPAAGCLPPIGFQVETDESLPETDKLPLLAKTLGVSLDALLSGEEEAPPQPAGPMPAKGGAVGKLAWLFRRWGWVGGLVLAAYGAFAFGLGLLARFLMGPMFPPLELLLQAGGPVRAAALGFQIITVAVLVVGGLAVVGGLIAAAVLYRRRPGGKK